VVQAGNWTPTAGVLRGGTNASSTYGFVYLTNSWTNFAVEATIQFPVAAFGGGIGGRLDPNTGAHYAAWVYPEGSPGGGRMLRLIKFQNWTSFGYNGTPFAAIAQASLPSVGTNVHSLKLSFQTNQIMVFYDGNQMISTTDGEALPYQSGGISVDMWTDTSQYVVTVDNVRVTAPSQNQTITFNAVGSKTYGDAPFVPSVSASSGLPITLQVISGPATVTTNNIVTLSATGSVTLRASQSGDSTNRPASLVDQSFTVNPAPLTISAANQTKIYGAALPALTLNYNGFVNGDTISVLTGTPSIATTAQASSPVGVYSITAGVGSLQASNYVLSAQNGQMTITKAPLSVSAYDAARKVGQTNPPLTVSYSGFVNGDDQTALTGAPSLATTATPASPPGIYPITTTAGNLAAVSYSFIFSDAVLRVLPSYSLFFDNFTRLTNSPSTDPWITHGGNWNLGGAGGATLRGGPNSANGYAFAYVTNAWDDFTVEARLQFPVGSFGGGLGGRLNPVTGAHYAAWIYPENSPGGSNILRLI
jgi:hypothetical protein